MKKIKLFLLLLATSTLNAQYYTNFSTSTFYDVNSNNDLHYDEGWTRDTPSMQIVNSEMKVSIFKNSTYDLNTGIISMKKGDIIFIDHRVSNASSSANLTISYVDSLDNVVFAKTIAYSSANIQSTVDTVQVNRSGNYKIKLSFTKGSGNNQQHFILKDFSIYNPTFLPYKEPEKQVSIIDKIEDEDTIYVYNSNKQLIYQGLKKDFFSKAEKNTIYIIKDFKFIIN